MLETFVVCFAVAIKDALGQDTGSRIAILSHQEMIVVGKQAVGDEGQRIFADSLLDALESK